MEKKEIKCVIFGNLVELKGTEIQKKKMVLLSHLF